MVDTARGYHDKHARAIYMYKERALPDSIVQIYREAGAALDELSREYLSVDVLYTFPRAVAVLERIAAELDAEFSHTYKRRYVRGAYGFAGPRADNKIYVWQIGLVTR